MRKRYGSKAKHGRAPSARANAPASYGTASPTRQTHPTYSPYQTDSTQVSRLRIS
jgi:hypothetical protein